jgi:ribosome biogenesis GTPase A
MTEGWLSYYTGQDVPALAFNAEDGGGLKRLLAFLKEAARPVREKWLAKGVRNKSIRVLVAGIPNVGKSSLINRLIKGRKAKAADTPGVTRGKQWLSAGDNIEVLDTPGILWPKLDENSTAFALAVSGAVKDAVFDVEEATLALLEFLRASYPGCLARYGLREPLPPLAEDILALIARQKGCLRSGGVVDTAAAAKLVLREFRSGQIGRMSLERAEV